MTSVSINNIIGDVKVAIDEIALNDSGFELDQDNSEMSTIIASKIPDALRFVYSNADPSLLEPDAVSTTADSGYSVDGKIGYYVLPDTFLRLLFAKFGTWKRYLDHDDLIMWNDPDYAKLSDTYATGTPERPKIALSWSGSSKCLELYSAGSGKEPVDFFAGYDHYLIGQGTFESSGEHDVRTLVKQGAGWYVYTSEIPLKPVAKICAIYDNGGVYTLSFFDPETITKEEMVADSDSFVIAYMKDPAEINISTESAEEYDKKGYAISDKVYRALIYYVGGLTLTTYREAQGAQLLFDEANDLMGFTAKATQTQQAPTQQ